MRLAFAFCCAFLLSDVVALLASSRSLCILWSARVQRDVYIMLRSALPLLRRGPHLFNWIGMSWHIWQSHSLISNPKVNRASQVASLRFALISRSCLAAVSLKCVCLFIHFCSLRLFLLSIDSNQANVGALSANVGSETHTHIQFHNWSGIQPVRRVGGGRDALPCAALLRVKFNQIN